MQLLNISIPFLLHKIPIFNIICYCFPGPEDKLILYGSPGEFKYQDHSLIDNIVTETSLPRSKYSCFKFNREKCDLFPSRKSENHHIKYGFHVTTMTLTHRSPAFGLYCDINGISSWMDLLVYTRKIVSKDHKRFGLQRFLNEEVPFEGGNPSKLEGTENNILLLQVHSYKITFKISLSVDIVTKMVCPAVPERRKVTNTWVWFDSSSLDYVGHHALKLEWRAVINSSQMKCLEYLISLVGAYQTVNIDNKLDMNILFKVFWLTENYKRFNIYIWRIKLRIAIKSSRIFYPTLIV